MNTPTRGIGDRTLDQVRIARAIRRRRCGKRAGGNFRRRARGRAKNALRTFIELIEALARETREMPLEEQIDHVLQRSGLRDHYAAESRGLLDSRTENLDELVTVASRFERSDTEEEMPELVAFLAYASLEAGEGQAQSWEDGAQLMTLHSAKGLEFPLVFLAVSRGLFPSQRSLDESGRLEGTPLAYVASRARSQKLVLSYAESRRIHGSDTSACPRASCARFRRRCCRKAAAGAGLAHLALGNSRPSMFAQESAVPTAPRPAGAPRPVRHRLRHRLRRQRRARARQVNFEESAASGWWRATRICRWCEGKRSVPVSEPHVVGIEAMSRRLPSWLLAAVWAFCRDAVGAGHFYSFTSPSTASNLRASHHS